MKSKKNILLLDDDEHFCGRMKVSLERGGDLKVIVPPNLYFESVEGAIKESPPDFVVLDLNLGDVDAKGLLQEIEGRLSTKCSIWLVSGVTDRKHIPLLEYQKITGRVRAVLAKPFFLRDLLDEFQRAEVNEKKEALPENKEETHGLPFADGYQHIALPVRVLDRDRQIVYANPAWIGALNRPRAQDFSWSEEDIPPPKSYWGSLIPGIKAVNYQIRSFFIPKNEDKGPWLGQVVEHGYGARHLDDLGEMVERVFSVMHSQGFPRGRFYRWIDIPGCDGLLRLEKMNHGSISLPIQHPLNGVLGTRLKKYETEEKPKKNDPLIVTIRNKEEEKELQDEGIQFWNRQLGVDDLASWLEMPVLRKAPREGYRPVGLFIFDRLGIDEQIQGSVLFDGEPNEVTQAEIDNVAPALRHVLCGVINAIKGEEKALKLGWYESLMALDDELEKIQHNSDEIEHALLATARKLTRAEGGVLALRQGQADFLKVQAVSGYVPRCLLSATLDLEALHHPVVRCWNDQKPVFVPDYKQSEHCEAVLRHANYQHLCPNHSDELTTWFDEGIGSLMAIPVTLGREVIGAISLQFKNEFAFTKSDLRVMELLVQRARWSLLMVNQTRFRRNWEIAFAHEIRSDLTVAAEALEIAVHSEGDLDRQKTLKTAMGQTTAVLDLSRNFMDLQNPNPEADRQAHFKGAKTSITHYLMTNKLRMEINEQQVVTAPPLSDSIWLRSLVGPENVFSRVLRNLFSNALKFGDVGAEIRLFARIDDRYFHLSLENPGQMTDEELENRFEPWQRSSRQRKPGAHVGLPASRKWVEVYGGRLEVMNVPDRHCVRADLYWPLAMKEK